MEEKIAKTPNPLEHPIFVLPNEERSIDLEKYISFSHTFKSAADGNLVELVKRFKMQFCSMGAGAFMFIGSGINFSYAAIGLDNYRLLSVSWLIGGIMGAFLAASVSKHLPRKISLYQAGVMQAVGALCFLLQEKPISFTLSGIAAGIAFVSTFSVINELTDKRIRGFMASWIDSVCFGLGISLEVLCELIFKWRDLPYVVGWLSFCCGLAVIGMTYFCVTESPVWYLLQGKAEQAIEAQRLLQQPYVVTDEVNEKIKEHKQLIEKNNSMSLKESASKGLAALFKICCLRVLIVLALSQMVILCRAPGTVANRLLGAVIGTISVDTFGRKNPTCIAVILGTISAVAIGITSQYSISYLNIVLLLFYQLTVGVMASTSAAYMSEAFPLQVKSYFLAITFTVEKIVQIILASLYCYNWIQSYFYILSVLGVCAFFLVKYFIPETKKTKPLEAQEKFTE